MQRFRRALILMVVSLLFSSGVISPGIVAAASTISGNIIGITGLGAANISVCLTDFPSPATEPPDGCIDVVATDVNGDYTFTVATDGTYTVIPFDPNIVLVPSERVATTGTASSVDNDFYVPTPREYTGTEVIAHRSDRVSSPENSDLGVRRAIEKEATHMEIDVQLGNDGQVIMTHGSWYRDERVSPPVGDTTTQIYGPTAACFDRNLEEDANVQEILDTCDIGTEMMILPGAGLGETWNPVFQQERFQTLEQVLDKNPGYCGWMIELKDTLKPDLTAPEAAVRNRQLGEAVQALLESKGLPTQCAGQLWVTSFEDSALAGVTNPDILKMRQVFPGVLNPPGAVNVAAIEGYDALNFDLAGLGEPAFPAGPTIAEYVRSRGFLVSAYTLTEQGPEQNTNAITRQADFFMTDILDDLQVQNGDTPADQIYQMYEANLQPPSDGTISRVVVRNEEVFDTQITLRAFEATGTTPLVDETFDLPDLAWATAKFYSDTLQVDFYDPEYTDGVFEPTIENPASLEIGLSEAFQTAYQAGNVRVEITGQHATFTNVDPLLATSTDSVTFRANGVDLEPGNPAVVGNTCGGPNVEDVEFTADLAASPPPDGGITAAQFFLDDELINEVPIPDAAGAINLSQLVEELAPGEHTLRVAYDIRLPDPEIFENDDGLTDSVEDEVEITFEAKVAPCSPAFVIDGTGSMSFEINNMRDNAETIVTKISDAGSLGGVILPASTTGNPRTFLVDAVSFTDALAAAGGLDLCVGAQRAVTGLDWGDGGVLFVLGDESSTGDPATCQAAAATALQKSVRIYGVYSGGDGNPNIQAALEAIATLDHVEAFVGEQSDFPSLLNQALDAAAPYMAN